MGIQSNGRLGYCGRGVCRNGWLGNQGRGVSLVQALEKMRWRLRNDLGDQGGEIFLLQEGDGSRVNDKMCWWCSGKLTPWLAVSIAEVVERQDIIVVEDCCGCRGERPWYFCAVSDSKVERERATHQAPSRDYHLRQPA